MELNNRVRLSVERLMSRYIVCLRRVACLCAALFMALSQGPPAFAALEVTIVLMPQLPWEGRMRSDIEAIVFPFAYLLGTGR